MTHAPYVLLLLGLLCADTALAESPPGCTAGRFADVAATPDSNPWIGAVALAELATSEHRMPPEIGRIRSGAVSHFVGGFINDGAESWAAYDADRKLFVSVIASSGQTLERTRERALRLMPGQQFIRTVSLNGRERRDFVTLAPARAEQAAEFPALGNALANEQRRLDAESALAAQQAVARGEPVPVPQPVWMQMTDVLEMSFKVVCDGEVLYRHDGTAQGELEKTGRSFIDAPLSPLINQAY